MKKLFTNLFTLLFAGAVGSVSAQTLLSEDFNSTSGSALPADWTQTTAATDGGFKTGTNAGLSSQAWPIPAANGRIVATNDDACNCDKSAERLSTPAIDMSAASTVFMSFKAFFYAGSYQGATESAKVQASTDGGNTWTDLLTLEGAADWQSVTVDISTLAGNADVRIGFFYNDGSGWTYGLGLDDISVYVPAALDVELVSNNMAEYVVQGSVPVVGTFFNAGSQAVTSLTVSYTVDGANAVQGTLNGINVAPLTSYDFTHPTAWNATTPGTYAIEITISAPNGGNDASPNNNSASATVNVATQSVTALPLVEEFSSNTCPPCASFNAVFIPLLEQNNTNKPNGLVSAVKYQMDWPSPGTDKSYNADGEARRAFYGVTGIPDVFLDGAPTGGTQAELNDAAARISVIDIQVNAVFSGNTITAEVTVTPYANFPAGLRLHMALTEDLYLDNTGTNGETEFHYIMRKMLSTGNGITLPAMTPGNSVTETRAFDATFGNVTQNSFNLWGENFDGVTIVAWVQNNTTGQVFQSAIDETVISSTATPEELTVKMFPNPVRDNLIIRADLSGSDDLQVNIFNSLGQKVAAQQFAAGAGYQNFNVSTSDLSNGVYMVQMVSGNKMSTRSVIVNR